MLSPRELKRLFAIARKAGIEGDALSEIVAARYQLSSRKALTRAQYQDLCAHLQTAGASAAQSSGRHRAGELANLLEITAFLNEHRGTASNAVPGFTSADLSAAAQLLDDFRRRRTEYGRISARNARTWLSWWARYDLPTWRAAVAIWNEHYRSNLDVAERYFIGIAKNVARARRLAA